MFWGQKLRIVACVCIGWAAGRGSALAFSTPADFARYSQFGGGEGRWFTGSPLDGYACDACHSAKPTLNPKLLPPRALPRATQSSAGPLVVTGLPEHGYVPGKKYEIRVTWPEYAARARPGYMARAPLGHMGINVEIVAESGQDSGLFEVPDYTKLGPGEACLQPSNLLATQLYRQPLEPYADGLDLNMQPPIADRPMLSQCKATEGTRCIIAVTACGAEQARFSWTAPRDFQGGLWFSAAFVATDERTSDPYEDAVTLVSHPIAPAAASSYVSELKASSCSLVIGGRTAAVEPWLALGLVAFVGRRRARAKARGGP